MSYARRCLLKTIVVIGIADLACWAVGTPPMYLFYYTTGAFVGYWIGYQDFWKRRKEDR